MPLNIPDEIYGIPLWAVLFVVAGFLLFIWKITGDPGHQDKYPMTRLFLFIATVFAAIAGIAHFVRWANPW